MKIGRNEACPCNSGKKYKKCCAAKVVIDLAWQVLRRTEGSVFDNHLLPYVMESLPPAFAREALEEFFPELPEEIDQEHFLNQFITPWFLFNWVVVHDFNVANFDPDKTIAMNYLANYRNQLSSNEIRFIEAMNETYYSFYSILEVEFEKTITIKDILLGTTHIIKERQGTHFLKRGDVIFSRLLTLDEQSICIGMSPFVFPTLYQTIFLDFRDYLIKENNNNVLTQEALRYKFDLDTVDFFYEAMIYLYDDSYPTLLNTDKELIIFSKSYFKLNTTPQEVLESLLPLTESKKPTELLVLETNQKDKEGEIKSIHFRWLKKGNKKHKNKDTVLGDIIIKQDKLILETNSEERLEKGKKFLNKYLSDTISFQKTLFKTPEQVMNSQKKPIKKGAKEALEMQNNPEVQEQLKLIAKEHWKDWLDTPVPVLKDKTPREAAKNDEGRERLEALMLHLERNKSSYFYDNINFIKSELELT